MTIEELHQLRTEIILGSIFTRDYENSLGIHPYKVQEFFDGYCDYLREIDDFDTKENLESWFYIAREILERTNQKGGMRL